jgi:hypothetical protein
MHFGAAGDVDGLAGYVVGARQIYHRLTDILGRLLAT